MAKGYPERASDADVAFPILDDVLSEETCVICKKRPSVTEHGLCATCHAALHGDAPLGARG
jgi:hypothetical protein